MLGDEVAEGVNVVVGDEGAAGFTACFGVFDEAHVVEVLHEAGGTRIA